jgi:hypothetical protein
MYKFQENCWFESKIGTALLLDKWLHGIIIIIHQLTIYLILVHDLNGDYMVILLPVLFGFLGIIYSQVLSIFSWKEKITLVFVIFMLLSYYLITVSTHPLSNLRGIVCFFLGIIFVAFSLAQKLYSSRVSQLSTEFTIMVTQNEITNAYIKRSLPLTAMGHYQNGVFPSLLFSSYNGFFQDVYQFFFFIILNILLTASFSLIVLFFGYRPSAYFKAKDNPIIGLLAGLVHVIFTRLREDNQSK